MDSLIKKNYIIRIPGIDDRRVYYAEITPAGEEIAGKYTDKNIKMFDNFLKNIPKEDVEPIYEALTQWQEFLVKMNTK
jgi:DNA-binding MarR family transcriptional regulator